MLMIRRRRGQSIVIGEDIVIHIANIHDHQVEVNIDAPRSIPIERKEVKDGLVPRRRTHVTDPTVGDGHA